MSEGKSSKRMMYGPSFPVDKTEKYDDKVEEMNSMVDLVRTLKEIDASPENIDTHKDGVIGENSGERIKLNDTEDEGVKQS